MRKAKSSHRILRRDLEEQIQHGQCVYCRRRGRPDRPLTREHVIPRARGGRRKDPTIIVPACARCNHRRGCQELVLFLLTRPRRISAFLDYLSQLQPSHLQQLDVRIYAELYAAVWLLSESSLRGKEWRSQLRDLSSGRTLHRRRYASRRLLKGVRERLGRRSGGDGCGAASCLRPVGASGPAGMQLEEPLDIVRARLLSVFAMAWTAPADEIRRLLERELECGIASSGPVIASVVPFPSRVTDEADSLSLDGWKSRRKRRMRVDRRRGRGVRARPSSGQMKGRAA